MVSAGEVADRFQNRIPRPDALIDLQIFPQLFRADRCHRMQQHTCNADHIEQIAEHLQGLLTALLIGLQRLCHVLAGIADVAVEDIGALVECEFGHVALIFEHCFFRFCEEFFFRRDIRQNAVLYHTGSNSIFCSYYNCVTQYGFNIHASYPPISIVNQQQLSS